MQRNHCSRKTSHSRTVEVGVTTRKSSTGEEAVNVAKTVSSHHSPSRSRNLSRSRRRHSTPHHEKTFPSPIAM